jgi:hypothetical protein
MTRARWLAGFLCAMAASSLTLPAQAQPAPSATSAVEGRVIEVQGTDLVLDLGASTGLRDGDVVQIWRPLSLRHPVTKRLISDRFLIGELVLVQVRPSMTLARYNDPLARTPEVGDVVLLPEVAVAKPTGALAATAAGASSPVATSQSTPAVGAQPGGAKPGAPSAAAVPKDIHAQRISMLMMALRGATPERRAQAYEKLAESDVGTPYATALRDEARALRGVQGLEPTAAPRPQGPPVPMVYRAPVFEEARAGEAIQLALEIYDAAGAVLHVRAKGKPSYTTLPMVPGGGIYFTVAIPGDEIEPPALELFVEATDSLGRAVAVLGSSDAPAEVAVRPVYEEVPPRDFLATVKIATDYADYNRLRGNDYAWQTEGEFGLRLDDTGVRAVRSGFGVYRGKGGGVDELDRQGREPREVGLTYGYLEGEFAPLHAFSLIPRVIVGLGDDGVTGGAQMLFRIGNDLETNLVLGGEVLGGVGVRGIAQLELATFERIPILLRTEVTNQPAGTSARSSQIGPDGEPFYAEEGSDVGARGIAEVGYRLVDQLVVRVRGSFQGRTIQHAGPGFGGGVSYSW